MVWLRRLAWAGFAVLVLWALAWLAVPPLLKWQAQTRLGEALGRSVSLGEVSFKPWSLELSVTDITVGAAPGAAAPEPLLRVARLYVDADIRSLFRRAPVIEALQIDAPQLRVARTAAGRYDVDDLIAKFSPKADDSAAEPARFALYNVQVRDGQVRFDDQPVKRVHQVDAMQLALPFLSNLPAQVDVSVEPRLAFKLDGTVFDSGAQATPFAQTRTAALKLTVGEMNLAPYLAYLPQALPVRLKGGVVSADLAVQFSMAPGAAPKVVVKGGVGVRNLAIDDSAGAPLLGWRQLKLGLRDVQPLARKLEFSELKIDGAQLNVVRDAAGKINLQRLAAPGPTAPAPAAPSPAGAAWQLVIDSVALADARVLWSDASVTPPAALQLDGIALEVKQVQLPIKAAMPLTLAATLRAQADAAAAAGSFTVQGPVTDQDAVLELSVKKLSLDALAPYLAQVLVPRVAGQVSAQGQIDWSGDAKLPRLKLALESVTLDAVRISEGSARAVPEAVSLKQLLLSALELDVLGRRVALGHAKLVQPKLALVRDEQGQWNVQRWVVASRASSASASANAPAITPASAPATAATASPATAATASPATAAAAAPWRVLMKDLSVEGGQLSLSDARPGAQARAQPVRVELTALRVAAQNLALPEQRGAAPAKLQLSVRVAAPAALPAAARTPPSQRDAGGLIDWKGQVATSPLLARGALRIERFPLHLFEPYFADKLNLSLLRAEAGYRGDLSVQESASGLSVSAAGDVLLADVQVHNRQAAASAVAATAGFAGTDELLSWQSLALKGLKVAVQAGAGPQVEVGEAALSDFYARLVVTEQGRLNLQDVAGPATAASAAAAGAAPAAAASGGAVIAASNPQPAGQAGVQADKTTGAQAEKPTGAQAGTPAGAVAGPPLAISVGSTRLVNGTVDFNDRFVRPNYSAKLTGLNGQLGAFRSGTRDMATLELRGRVAGTALLDISGQLNPTADPLALDIKAKATDLELAPLSPYAGKYAGYAIERGKLSMEVAYKISPDGKLEASNQVILNQLTFGDKIDSPEATKLPVLLAVALLKDRHGVIDINLPVSGSLNDPQFSVGGIIVKVIINLLTKAFTAPFALLAGGGGSDDLSLVEFKPGTSVLTASGASAIEKVAKSLVDRPALKMTVTGAADPVSERADYQRAALEARLTAERRREALRDGAAADAPVVMSAEDRARLLTELYRQTDMPGKPRNAIGLLRDIPGPEMEALLLPRTLVSAEVMRELALQRGLAVRDGLVAKGLPSERLFLAAPKLRASGEDEAAWTPRVQLALSVN